MYTKKCCIEDPPLAMPLVENHLYIPIIKNETGSHKNNYIPMH